MDIREYNRDAWDKQVAKGNEWTLPVKPEVIARARQDDWSLLLTETKAVPRAWFNVRERTRLQGLDILCLASGGGQQAPTLAAAGARVTVLDNSPRQLAQDRLVAEREGLEIRTLEGDARNLEMLGDEEFDLVFHPVSNLFIPEILPVWREAYRVLRQGGVLLAGFLNPAMYLFTYNSLDGNEPLVVKHRLPYSDVQDLPQAELEQLIADSSPLEYSHTLTEQIGGQLRAGVVLTDLYEDAHRDAALGAYKPTYIATRAVKP